MLQILKERTLMLPWIPEAVLLVLSVTRENHRSAAFIYIYEGVGIKSLIIIYPVI